jgi:hypothetical protein
MIGARAGAGEVIDDGADLRRSDARLLDCDFDALLLCDGEPVPSGRTGREFVEDETG